MIMEKGWNSMQEQEKKHRVGILTYHYAHNFGAVLQAFAMQEFLDSEGFDARVINYRNVKISRRYKKRLSFWFAVRKRDWLLPWHWRSIVDSIHKRNLTLQDWQKQCDKFEYFEHKYLKIEPSKKISQRKIKELEVSSIVFGSDQIWDTGITGRGENVYWGNVGKGCVKKISYAASIYGKYLSKNEKRKAVRYLPSFDCLAVREETLAEELKQLLHREVRVVVDPTLLLPCNHYFRFINTARKHSKRYSLVYMVSESEELLDIAKSLRFPVINVHYYKSIGWKEDGIEEIADAGPEDFLNMIFHAEYVITNSFHGTVFSILFQKKFCAVYKENVRIDHLLKVVGMSQAHIRGTLNFNADCMISCTDKNLKALEHYVQYSKDYIINGLS